MAAGAQGLLLSTGGTNLFKLNNTTLNAGHVQMTIKARKMTTMTKSFIIQPRHSKVQCVHHLCSRSLGITLAGGLHPEHRRTLHPIYHKLPTSESLLTKPHRRWSHQNIHPLPHMRCVRVGKEITTSKAAAIVNVASVSYSVGYV